MSCQLYDYLETNSVLHKEQNGFRAKKSITQAILHFLQYLNKNVNSGNVVFSLFLDFRKAFFDCVSHIILLSKLNTYGIPVTPLDWFHSYLNREQYICINNVNSNAKTIQCVFRKALFWAQFYLPF